MSWARDEVLFRAQFDLVRSLVEECLAVIGNRTQQGFVEWTLPVGDKL
jgi:hypothetical protein